MQVAGTRPAADTLFPRERTMDLQAYDILQISRDNGEHWLDFTTLRDARDFRLAQSLVTGGQWNGESVLFRVVRWAPTAMDSRGFTVLAETTPNVDDEPPTETTPQDLSLSPQAKAKQMSFDLETMIDKTSLAQVLDLIAEICALKAEHISENWGDKRLAHDWRSAGKRV